VDRTAIQKHVDAIRTELKEIEEKQKVLMDILKGYENWIRLSGDQQLEMNVKSSSRKGTMSFPKGLKEVLRQAGGAPLRDTEIWERMQGLGIHSDAKNPVNFVSLHSNKIQEIEKTDTRTYRWVGVQETE